MQVVNVLINKQVNLEVLAQTLMEALGPENSGVRVQPGEVTIYMSDMATDEQLEHARYLVLEHNPATMTSYESALIELVNTVKPLREIDSEILSVDDFTSEPAYIRQLVGKVKRLEAEIALLRHQCRGM